MAGVIVHEWIEPIGGAEQVVDQMMLAFPDADLWCAWNNAPERYQGRRVFESPIAKTPFRGRKALALPVMTATWRRLNAQASYDWALISSHAFAHHARFTGLNRDIPKLAYVHTPARYVWLPELDERGSSLAARVGGAILRPADRKRAQEITEVAANSNFIRQRIRDVWKRDARVIYPPVDVEAIFHASDTELTESEQEALGGLPAEFLLGASRFVPYKRMDVVIDAGVATGIPIVLAGGGPEEENLRSYAREKGASITIVDRPSDEMLRALYRKAVALVFPAIEDFGIMPVEATASGTPVLVSNIGGTTESIQHGLNGIHIQDWNNAGELKDGVSQIQKLDRNAIRQSAERFSNARFADEITAWVAGI